MGLEIRKATCFARVGARICVHAACHRNHPLSRKQPLTSLRAIHALSNAQASHQLPVSFEATVTYYRDYERTLFVQDGDSRSTFSRVYRRMSSPVTGS